MKRLFLQSLAVLAFAAQCYADCAMVEFDNDSNKLRMFLTDSATGTGKTALDNTSGGLNIATIADNEATATVYTSAGSTVETITTLGTFAAPTATKARFKKIDDTNMPGLYEIQLDNARFAVASSTNLIVEVTATGILPSTCSISLVHPLSDVTAAILNATAASYNTAGSIGAAINTGGSGGSSATRSW